MDPRTIELIRMLVTAAHPQVQQQPSEEFQLQLELAQGLYEQEKKFHQRTKDELCEVKQQLVEAHKQIDSMKKRTREADTCFESRKRFRYDDDEVEILLPVSRSPTIRMARIPFWNISNSMRCMLTGIMRDHLPNHLFNGFVYVGYDSKWRQTENKDVILMSFRVKKDVSQEFENWVKLNLN